jgi:glycosyltransferase involved in cell wall biosynthesis
MVSAKISVIIPVRNQANKIEQCLKAVFAQSLQPHEVIIVDGHSTDDTVEEARKFPVKVFSQEQGAAGAARQIGVENADGEYLAFTDGDCIPDKDWLKTLSAEFQDDIIAVGGAMKNVGSGLWPTSINLALENFLGNANQLQATAFKKKRLVKELGIFNAMYRREAILAAGGFNIHLGGADETELNKRISKKGKMLYTPDTVVLHDHGRGLKEFAKNMFRYGTWRRQSRMWDLPVVPPLVAPLLLLSLIFTRWVFFPLMALYLVMLTGMGVKFAVHEKDIRYVITIPIVYIIEHVGYTIGFWKEVFKPAKIPKASGEQRQ